MPYIEKEVEVWVDLDDFSDEELAEEMANRNMGHNTGALGIIQKMYDYQHMGKDIQPLLNELYYSTIKRIA